MVDMCVVAVSSTSINRKFVYEKALIDVCYRLELMSCQSDFTQFELK